MELKMVRPTVQMMESSMDYLMVLKTEIALELQKEVKLVPKKAN